MDGIVECGDSGALLQHAACSPLQHKHGKRLKETQLCVQSIL